MSVYAFENINFIHVSQAMDPPDMMRFASNEITHLWVFFFSRLFPAFCSADLTVVPSSSVELNTSPAIAKKQTSEAESHKKSEQFAKLRISLSH